MDTVVDCVIRGDRSFISVLSENKTMTPWKRFSQASPSYVVEARYVEKGKSRTLNPSTTFRNSW